MRYIVILAVLLAAGCAPQPATTPTPEPAASEGRDSGQDGHRTLNGMTAGELIQYFGKPKLQIVEGDGTKLQFAGPNCTLDVYLYPPEGKSGPARASYIVARNVQGGSVDAQSCSTAIANR